MNPALRDIAEFTAKRFAPRLTEDCQVNPGAYGAELAFWLCTELADRGVATSYPHAEDWGWFIEYFPSSGSEFAVHCCNVQGHDDRWLLSLYRHARKLLGRDRPPYSEAEPLVKAIRALLKEADGVTEINWRFDHDA